MTAINVVDFVLWSVQRPQAARPRLAAIWRYGANKEY